MAGGRKRCKRNVAFFRKSHRQIVVATGLFAIAEHQVFLTHCVTTLPLSWSMFAGRQQNGQAVPPSFAG